MREEALGAASKWAAGLPMRATIVLVGSYARGDFNLWSDIDVLIISEDFIGSPIERLKALDPPPGFQAIPLTPGEFERLMAKRDPLAVEALGSGAILRDDLKLFEAGGLRGIDPRKGY